MLEEVFDDDGEISWATLHCGACPTTFSLMGPPAKSILDLAKRIGWMERQAGKVRPMVCGKCAKLSQMRFVKRMLSFEAELAEKIKRHAIAARVASDVRESPEPPTG